MTGPQRQTLGVAILLATLAIAIIAGSEHLRQEQAVMERGPELP